METSPVPAGDLLPPPAERPELFGGGEVNACITQSQFLLSKVHFFKDHYCYFIVVVVIIVIILPASYSL